MVTSLAVDLRRRNCRRRLLLGENVQLVQVRLDVAVRERLALLDAEHLAHRGIRVDRVTLLGILELVAINVGAERTRDIRRRHLAAVRLAEEGAETVTERHGGREDGGALGDWRGTLDRRSTVAAAATTGLLDLTRGTLLELAERLKTRDGRITDGLELRREGLDVLGERGGGLRGGGRGDLRGRRNRLSRRRNSRRSSRGSLRLLGDLLRGSCGTGGSCRRSSCDSNRGSCCGNNGDSFLLGGDLLHDGLGCGTHCTTTGGIVYHF